MTGSAPAPENGGKGEDAAELAGAGGFGSAGLPGAAAPDTGAFDEPGMN
jgi:hypothetical protein